MEQNMNRDLTRLWALFLAIALVPAIAAAKELPRVKPSKVGMAVKKLDKVDLLIVQIGRIGHKTSEPVMKAAKDRNLQTITVKRPTRDALTMALRVGLAEKDASGKPGLAGFDLGGLAD